VRPCTSPARPQRIGEDAELRRLDGELAGLGAQSRAAREDDVPQVRQLEQLVGLLAHLVLLDEDLQVAGAVAQAEEAGLPMLRIATTRPATP